VSATDPVAIERRFRGPDDSGQGGYTCGLVAAVLGNPAEVRLRRPPPLERSLTRVRTAEGVELRDGEDVVAEGRPIGALEVELPPRVGDDGADAGTVGGLEWATTPGAHPFPRCFGCGPEREPGDALRIFAGPVPGRDGVYAATWTPDASLGSDDDGGAVDEVFVWAALDCPTSAPVVPTLADGQAVVLGTMAAEIRARPRVGTRHVIMSWLAERTDRVAQAMAVLHAGDEPIAVARGTWVHVDRERFGGG